MPALKDMLTGLRFIGIGNGLRSVRYALLRDWAERGLKHTKNEPPQHPGQMTHFEPIPSGALFSFEQAELEILYLTPRMVRVTWKPGEIPIPYALADVEWMPVETDCRDTGMLWSVSSAELEVFVTPEGGLRYLDMAGEVLRIEEPPERIGEGWRHKAKLNSEEHIYGLGERAAPLDLRGGVYSLWNTDPAGSYGPGDDPLYVTIPLYHSQTSQGGYLVFYENSYEGEIALDAPSPNEANTAQQPDESIAPDLQSDYATTQFEGGALRYYFTAGSPAETLADYTKLTGRPPLPPRWALAYHQCRWGYKSEDEIRAVVAGFKEHDLPLSAVHLDIDYMDGYRVFTVDETRFPDLAKLAEALSKEGVRLVTILDPGVKRDRQYEVYREGLEADVFCKLPNGKLVHGLVWPQWCAFPDFTHPEARHWWGGYYRRLVEAGIAGFWHDMNEPESFSAWGDSSLPRNTRHHMEGTGGDHRQAHNIYGLLMSRAGYEALRKLRPDERPWLLSRSGWAGLQRYAWHWTGDTESTWEALRMTIAEALNLSLSGIYYTGADIGGFSNAPSAELYTRWLQMTTFLPFCRTHSAIGTPAREPWTFGEPTLSIVREFLELRYHLLPYLYTLAWEASQEGKPLVRPCFWPGTNDPDLLTVDDAFFLGEALLVAPIVSEGATSRRVRLPAGHWYDFWDGRVLEGNRVVRIEAPLERIPLLVRAGSVLPMEAKQRLSLHVYPPLEGEGDGRLYSDAGDGYGDWRIDRFELAWDKNHLKLSWGREGEAPFPYTQVEVLLHGLPARGAWVDGEKTAMRNNQLECGVFNEMRFKLR